MLLNSASSCDIAVDGPSCYTTSSELIEVAMLQKRHRREQEAASLLTAVVVNGHAQCSYSQYTYICLFTTKVASNKEKETHKVHRRQRQTKGQRQNQDKLSKLTTHTKPCHRNYCKLSMHQQNHLYKHHTLYRAVSNQQSFYIYMHIHSKQCL